MLWVAEHSALRNEVVVKFLSDELADDPSAARRIAREAAAAARVKSPHVVHVLDYGVTDGTPFVVMELLEGCDLRAHLEARGTLWPDETTQVIRQRAKALGKTHEAGLVHRDVKPSNIFLLGGEPEVFVKLLDFGLAQSAVSAEGSTAGTRSCAGTPPYMSPEQIVGGNVDARSDVWSMGVVAFQCLTGTRPFEGETLGAVALAIHTLALPRVTDFRNDLPRAIDEWFARVCARSRDERFASAVEAADALDRVLGTRLPAVGKLSQPSVSSLVEDRTASNDFALIQPRATASPWQRSRVWIGGATLTILSGVAAVAFVGTNPPRSRADSASASASAAPSAKPAVQPIRQEAVAHVERTPEPEAPSELPSKAPAPRPSRISAPSIDQVAIARDRPPVASAPPPSASPDAAPPPSTDARPRLSHSFELPDERY